MIKKYSMEDKEIAYQIIDDSKYGVISMIDEEGFPYGLPLSIVRDGDNLYFHTGKVAKKTEIFKDNPSISITFVSRAEVPEIYTAEDLKELRDISEKEVGKILGNVFTMNYESAIVKGKVELVEKREDKMNIMKMICNKYAPTKMDFFQILADRSLGATDVYELEMEDMRAKIKD